jgi:3-oxoadipate enol-lactonase
MANADVNGTSLHYRLDGPEGGLPILLSNSLMSNLTMWDPQIEPLTAAGFQVLRYDSRGHGKSGAPEGPYSIEMLAEDAVGLMDAVGWDSAHFCGLSKGGMVGQMLGSRHPDRVRSLVLCDTSSYMGGGDIWDQRIAGAQANGIASLIPGTIDRWFTKPGQTRIPDEIEKVRVMIASTPVTGFAGCCQAIKAMDQRETNKSINKPTIVIVGAEDSGTTPAQAREIHKAIAGSELVILDSAAHLANIEQAGPFNDTLIAFLGRVR